MFEGMMHGPAIIYYMLHSIFINHIEVWENDYPRPANPPYWSNISMKAKHAFPDKSKFAWAMDRVDMLMLLSTRSFTCRVVISRNHGWRPYWARDFPGQIASLNEKTLNLQGSKLIFFQGAQLHLRKLPISVLYRKQYIFGLPAEIWWSRRRIQGSHPLISNPDLITTRCSRNMKYCAH